MKKLALTILEKNCRPILTAREDFADRGYGEKDFAQKSKDWPSFRVGEVVKRKQVKVSSITLAVDWRAL